MQIEVDGMKEIFLLYFSLIMIIIPGMYAGETGNLSVWQVTDVTDYSENGITKGDTSIYKEIVYEQVSNSSMVLTVNMSDKDSMGEPLILNGDILSTREFSAQGSDGEIFFGSLADTDYTRLYILPSPSYGDSSFTILNLSPDLNQDEISKGVVFNTADITNPFMAVTSSEVNAAKEKNKQSDEAWLPGNSIYKDNPAITCKDKECGCEGETCSCIGSDCVGEGRDADYSADGYRCLGFDCLLTCVTGKDCELKSNNSVSK